MAAGTNAAKTQEDVREEIRARTVELQARVEKAKAAAASIPSHKPVERELIEFLKKAKDPVVLRQIHVAVEAMKNVWDAAKRLEGKGVPWIAVARPALVDLASGFLAARERGEILSPDQAQAYVLVAELLRQTTPEWEAFCRFERRKAAMVTAARTDAYAAARRPLTDRATKNHEAAEATDKELLPRVVELVRSGKVTKEIQDALRMSEGRVKRIRRRAVGAGLIPKRGTGLRGTSRR